MKRFFRYGMDIIPFDAGLIKGSYGAFAASPDFYSVLISDTDPGADTMLATGAMM